MPNASSRPKTPPEAPTVGTGGWFMLPITTQLRHRRADHADEVVGEDSAVCPSRRSTSPPNMYSANMLKNRCVRLPCRKP